MAVLQDIKEMLCGRVNDVPVRAEDLAAMPSVGYELPDGEEVELHGERVAVPEVRRWRRWACMAQWRGWRGGTGSARGTEVLWRGKPVKNGEIWRKECTRAGHQDPNDPPADA